MHLECSNAEIWNVKQSSTQLLIGALVYLFQLLETMIKNCGDIVHMHVAERDILHEMVKIVKKRVCMSSSNFNTYILVLNNKS